MSEGKDTRGRFWISGEALTRWGIAAVVLILFYGLLAYRYAPAWAPRVLGLAQPALNLRAERLTSAHFEIHNRSDARPDQVQNLQSLLERQYSALIRFLGREPDGPIQVDLQNGTIPALPANGRLQVFYNGYIDTETVGFALAMLIAGRDDPLFTAGGVALYALEETEMLPPFIRQDSDAWVTWLDRKGLYLPLERAMAVGLSSPPEDIFRAVVEGASFTRWLVARAGWEAYWGWFDGADFAETFGMTLSEAETMWLADVRAQNLEPLPCAAALSGSFSGLCRELER